jgi:hypothetical protein
MPRGVMRVGARVDAYGMDTAFVSGNVCEQFLRASFEDVVRGLAWYSVEPSPALSSGTLHTRGVPMADHSDRGFVRE